MSLIRQFIFSCSRFCHPKRYLLMIPVLNINCYRSLTLVWFVNYFKFLAIVWVEGIINSDSWNTGIVPDYGCTMVGKKSSLVLLKQKISKLNMRATAWVSSSESRASWARLIAKIYEIKPMVCPKCASPIFQRLKRDGWFLKCNPDTYGIAIQSR